jgi:hypothetical protein
MELDPTGAVARAIAGSRTEAQLAGVMIQAAVPLGAAAASLHTGTDMRLLTVTLIGVTDSGGEDALVLGLSHSPPASESDGHAEVQTAVEVRTMNRKWVGEVTLDWAPAETGSDNDSAPAG